ncbi:myocardin-related transcription factor B [Chanos chanos]|uniref:Myocardin-related transcription factor B n=1 Tax=Chanos chanos TaxID=29144 RepID=A0A6J2WMT7_CHACN|nr:myocardin-related transcription factor B-like [Chanos chanos]
MESQGCLGVEGDLSLLGMLVPSPRSEAVTHEMEELSLQSSHSLPPIKERRNVLQLRLQQRRTREQLVDQGIIPPLKSPAAFHEQIRSLERARTENFLKHKIRSRPERAELVRMHILQETQAEPSLQATQMKLKRARLADDLNEKIAQRPGPMELVEKNILPMDSSVKEAIIVGGINYPKTLDVYNFEEDSSDALSPEQPASQESQGSGASPKESRLPEALPTSSPTSSNLQMCVPTSQNASDLLIAPAKDQTNSSPIITPQPVTTVAPTKPSPTLIKQSQAKQAGDKNRSKKCKEPKPRVKKLKYHQYIPPDQKQDHNEAPMDSAYARLLQQQQQFLHLQILSQQQQQFNYQAILPAPLKTVMEGQNKNSPGLPAPIVASLPGTALARQNHTLANRKPGPLPANLDEMKVPELKMELKLRGLPVSGTKTDLIERLKPYQESPCVSSAQPAVAMETSTPSGAVQPEAMNSTPPVSPGQSEVSNISTEEAGGGDSVGKNLGTPSPGRSTTTGMSSHKLLPEDIAMDTKVSEKDQRLHEKERQIEELIRKLEHEQRLVEELKMQLEVEKRSQQANCQQPEPCPPVPIKEENSIAPSCSSTQNSVAQIAGIKQEELPAQVHPAPMPQFYISAQQVPQVLQQPQAVLAAQPGTQVLMPVSLPTAIQLSNNSIKPQSQVLQTAASSPAQGLIQTSPLQPQNMETSAPPQLTNPTNQSTPQAGPLCSTSNSGFQYRLNQTQPLTELPRSFLNSSPEAGISSRNSPRQTTPNGPTHKPPSPCQPSYILHPSTFPSHSPKGKDPPRYEEAVKQTRGLQASVQVPTATSQHMDDLFDVLIESGEISPLVKHDPLSLDKMLPVTASVTTLPINTVLSRPPPQVQVAQPPSQTQDHSHSLVALATDNQLEALLEGTLSGDTETRTLRLMEELHSQLLEQPHSPMDTTELAFSDAPPSALHLQDTNLDNMEWLDLTMPGTAGIPPPGGVFSSDFLDSNDLPLHWD